MHAAHLEQIRPIVDNELKIYGSLIVPGDIDDYYQEATLRFLECERTWDPECGLSFDEYTKKEIKQAINNLAIMLSLPLSFNDPQQTYQEDVQHHIDILKKEFTLDEIGEILNYNVSNLSI